MATENPKIICLMGPTASGKTKTAIELAQHIPCSIISVDSGMIYKGMDIGTAKPSKEELKIAPHSLIDICEPTEIYSAGKFLEQATSEIEKALALGKKPLLVGGTMMYFNALQKGLSKLPSADMNIRANLLKEAIENGIPYLHEKLKKIDAFSASKIQPNDLQRLQRALEIYEITGKTPSEAYKENQISPPPYSFINLALCYKQKSTLNEKIEQRFDLMLKQGFLDEVDALFHNKNLNDSLPSMRLVGYREAWQYMEGKIDRETMREKAIISTRQLAKRQMTWLRSWPNLRWFDSCETDLLLDFITRESS